MVGRATEAAMGRANFDTLQKELTNIAETNFIEKGQVRVALSEGLNAAAEILFDDGLLTRAEEKHLRDYISHFSLERSSRSDIVSRLDRGDALRELFEGRLPDSSHFVQMDLPFNFQKSESLVWVFPDVNYYERRTRRIRQGASHGVSVRLMRGLYYQPRVFQSESIERNVTEYVDKGTVAVTDKHIYFSGQEKSFRVNYSRIVSFDGYADGFSLVRDAASARPQIFITGDGWFSYNLVSNLAQRKV